MAPMEIAIRDACVPLNEGQSLWDALRLLGIASVELAIDAEMTVRSLQQPLQTADQIRGLRDRLWQRGVRVCALLLATDFSGADAEAHIAWTMRAVALANELGTPAVRIDAFTADRSLSADVVRDNVGRCVRRILAETAGSGVDLALENHAWHSNDPAFLDGLFAAVDDDRLGLTLDTGNFYWFGYPLEELYGLFEKYAGCVKHTHMKNINYPPEMAHQRRPIGWEYGKYRCPLDEGNIDLARVVRLLRGAGYQRDLCIENESLNRYPEAQRLEIIRRDVRALQRAE
jgi:sugar phosphate isomerase/epimerase